MFYKFFILTFLLFCSVFGAVITPIDEVEYDRDKALLGKALFFDTRLSTSGRSCQHCHHLKGELTGTTKNAPWPASILNSAGNYYYTKNGEMQDLKAQIIDIFHDAGAYNTSPDFFIEQIKKNGSYRKQFEKIYGKITFINAVDALREFILALRSQSRFDRFLLGDEEAMSEAEKQGYSVFVKVGCIACHNGTNLGGGMVAFIKRENGTTANVRVPSLRNVLRTEPWMSTHSSNLLGAILWLKNSIINVNVNTAQVVEIMEFFKALDSDVPEILKDDGKPE